MLEVLQGSVEVHEAVRNRLRYAKRTVYDKRRQGRTLPPHFNDYEKGDLYSQTDWNSLFIAPIIPMSG